MDTFFLIVGGLLILISVILIAKSKSRGSEADTFEHALRDDMDLELDLDDEELRFMEEVSDEDYADEYEEEREDDYPEEVEEAPERGAIDHRDTVAIMYKAGMSPNEIAKKLEMGKREVEIILKVKGLVK